MSARFGGSGLIVGNGRSDPLVTAWADDLFLHGVHLGRWIVDYVDLEESLAVGTLAQEQLAHARELLAATGLDDIERDRHFYDRPVDQWAPSRLAADPMREWPQVVAVGLLLTHATLAVLAEADLIDSAPTAEDRTAEDRTADDPTAEDRTAEDPTAEDRTPDVPPEVAQNASAPSPAVAVLAETARIREPAVRDQDNAARIAGIAAEQRLHLMHWQRWAVLLAGSRATRAGFLDTLHWAGEHAGDLLGDLRVSEGRDDAGGPGGSDHAAGGGRPGGWPMRARERFFTDIAVSLSEADVPSWSFAVDRPRRAGEHAALIEPVLAEQRFVRANYPDPVLEPR